MFRIPLSYGDDSTLLYERIRHLPYPAFLDSGAFGEGRRFDILCADPLCRMISQQGRCHISGPQAPAEPPAGSPFQQLKKLLARFGFADNPAQPWDTPLPFVGGALGYFGYDLGRTLEHLPSLAEQDIAMADMQVGIYPWSIVVDHQREKSWLVYSDPSQHDAMRALADQLAAPAQGSEPKDPFKLLSPFRSNMDATGYRSRFRRIIDYIHSGDCYQVNLAQRFSARFSGDCWQAYRLLRQAAPTPFSAFLEVDDGQILSLSPERFLQVRSLRVETRPIKGTRPRSDDGDTDRELKRELSASPKDRAENLMIVDLLRNDLGRTCQTGSVSVPSLFDVESYTNVHHLVSTVTGRLDDPQKCLDLLENCFPGGSITGAPKIRAMEIIEELEPQRRSAYCGTIGYIGVDGTMDTNIAIRTLVAHDGRLHCWAGGGIVADSQCESEYQETFDKVDNLTGPLERNFL